MDFGKALEALKAGKKVRRSTWNINYYIIYGNVHDKNEYPFGSFDGIATYKDGTYSRNLFEFTPEHLIAEDWEMVEDIQEVKLHIKEYFTCPKCGHENIDFHLDNWYSTCKKCETKVKTLPRCNRSNIKYAEVVEKYKEYIKKMISGFDDEIKEYTISGQYQRAGISAWYKEANELCLKSLNQIEAEALEQQRKDTN